MSRRKSDLKNRLIKTLLSIKRARPKEKALPKKNPLNYITLKTIPKGKNESSLWLKNTKDRNQAKDAKSS